MKVLTSIILALAATLTTAWAQDVDAKKKREKETELQRQQQATQAVYRVEAPNRIRGKQVSYSGATVHAVKLGNPLQLINPFAPLEHGNGTDNLAPPMRRGEPPKIAVFTIEY